MARTQGSLERKISLTISIALSIPMLILTSYAIYHSSQEIKDFIQKTYQENRSTNYLEIPSTD